MPDIIIEDGTLASASANSYVSIANVSAYCVNMGYTTWASLSTTDQGTAILRGMVYIDSLQYKGYKTAFTNPLQWPRMGVYGPAADIQGYPFWDNFPQNEIPNSLKRATCQAAYEESVSAGILLPTSDANIKKEKIDVLEIEYFDRSEEISSSPVFAKIKALMVDILKSDGGNFVTVKRT